MSKKLIQSILLVFCFILLTNNCFATSTARLQSTIRVSIDGALFISEEIRLKVVKKMRTPVRSIFSSTVSPQMHHDMLSLTQNGKSIRSTKTKSGFVLGKKNSFLAPGTHTFKTRYVVYAAIKSDLFTSTANWSPGNIGHHIGFDEVSLLFTLPKFVPAEKLQIHRHHSIDTAISANQQAYTVSRNGNIETKWKNIPIDQTIGLTIQWPSEIMIADKSATAHPWFFQSGKYAYWGWLGLLISSAYRWIDRTHQTKRHNILRYWLAVLLSFGIFYISGVLSTNQPLLFTISFIAGVIIFVLLQSTYKFIDIHPFKKWRMSLLVLLIFALCWDLAAMINTHYLLLLLTNSLLLTRILLPKHTYDT